MQQFRTVLYGAGRMSGLITSNVLEDLHTVNHVANKYFEFKKLVGSLHP